jgi:hypothetical protein
MSRPVNSQPIRRLPGGLPLLLALTLLLATFAPASAAPSESLRVWRAQVRFVTSSSNSDSGTDDDIQVALNDTNRTWLDYGRDDFETGDTFTYDLLLTNLRTLTDIKYLAVQKTGTDGWCVESVTLLINGQSIYYRSFKTSTTACHWIDADDGHSPALTISGTALRNNSLWQAYTPPARPTKITRTEFERRVEATVGNWIEGVDSTYKWGHLYGSRYVEGLPKDDRTLHFDLDLTRIYNNWPDGEFDVDFDARFACSNGRLSVSILNVIGREYTPYALDVPGTSVPDLQEQLQAGTSAPLAALNAMLGTLSASCPTVLIDGAGDLAIPQAPYAISMDPINPIAP